MNWIAFFILSYVCVALQSGLTPLLRYGASEPNLCLLAVVFIASALTAMRFAVWSRAIHARHPILVTNGMEDCILVLIYHKGLSKA